MKHAQTLPFIQAVILQTLLFMNSFSPNKPNNDPNLFRIAVEEQDRIGILNFLVGKLSNKWSQLQEEHFRLSPKLSKRAGR